MKSGVRNYLWGGASNCRPLLNSRPCKTLRRKAEAVDPFALHQAHDEKQITLTVLHHIRPGGIWARHQLRWKLKARIVRYADDFVVLCAGSVDPALATVRQVLDRLELTLNENKTRIVDARKESFNFLGFVIRVSKGLKTGKSYPHVCPAPKSLAKIKDRITQLTTRDRTLIPWKTLLGV